MEQADVRAAAERLAAAWLAAGDLQEMPPARQRPRDRTEAYAIQDEMARIIDLPVGGWKMGATSPAVRRSEGHSGPIVGRVFAAVIHHSPAELPAARFPHARVEAEFGFRMLADLPPRTAPYRVADVASLVELVPTIEIIGNRYPKGEPAPKLSTYDEIADNGTGIGLLVGATAVGWTPELLQNLVISLCVDGGAPAPNVLGEDRCVPLDIVAETANILSARGITLARGQVISTGGCTTPQHVRRGSTVVADYGPLGTLRGQFV